MSRNDLVVFEFSNGDPRAEVFLRPETVSEVAGILSELVSNWLKYYEPEETKFEILLAAVDRGSIKLAYLVKFAEGANTVIDFIGKVAPILITAGVAGGVFVPLGGASSKEESHQASPEYVSACADGLQKLVRTAATSGAEQVSLSIAGCGEVRISDENSRDPTLIGSWAAYEFDGSNEYQGALRKIKGPFTFTKNMDGAAIQVYSGEIQLRDSSWVPVVFHWGSKRSIQDAIKAGDANIAGITSPIRNFMSAYGGLTTKEAIDPTLRRAEAYLYVNSQTVSE